MPAASSPCRTVFSDCPRQPGAAPYADHPEARLRGTPGLRAARPPRGARRALWVWGRDSNARQRTDLRRACRHLHVGQGGALQPVEDHRIRPGQLTPARWTPRTITGAGTRQRALTAPVDCTRNWPKPVSSIPIDEQRFAVETEMSQGRAASYT